MSDVMLLAVLRMPRDIREDDAMARRQFDSRVLEAADELEARTKRIAELEQDILDYIAAAEADEAKLDESLTVMADCFLRQTASIKEFEAKIAKQEEDLEYKSGRITELEAALRGIVAKFSKDWNDTYYHFDDEALKEVFRVLEIRDGCSWKDLFRK